MYKACGTYEHFSQTLPTTLDELFKTVVQSGTYKLWSPIDAKPINVFVYVDRNQRRWALVLRYNHKGGTNPELKTINSGDFPIPPNPANLLAYRDESKTPRSWGHLSTKYLSQFNIKEVAFFASTSEHPRIINFTTSSKGPIDYIKNGTGGFNFGRCFCTEPGGLFDMPETASLPRFARLYRNSGTLTDSPFYNPGLAYWSIRTDGARWEVDNSLDPSADEPSPPPKENTEDKNPKVREDEKDQEKDIEKPKVKRAQEPKPERKPTKAELQRKQQVEAKQKAEEQRDFYKYHTLHMVLVR